jgi:sodium pump decarboxylase gamma subunit
MTTAQIFQESLKTTIFCMGLVLVTLYLLSLILELMRVVFAPRTNLTKNKTEPKAHTTEQSINHLQTTDAKDDTQLIAVITAAISEYMGKPITHIKIGAIRKIHEKTPIWGMESRIYNINNKL